MNKKIVWLVVSCLMVAALVLTSCAAAVTEEEEEITPPTEEEEVTPPTEEEEEEVGPEMITVSLERDDGSMFTGTIEKPQYGGTITVSREDDPMDFDEAFANTWTTWTLGLTNDGPLVIDWRRGPSGTDEHTTYLRSNLYPLPMSGLMGYLAESWEIPDALTQVFQIRQGVHFALDPDSAASRLVNGRELTAEDVGYSISRVFDNPGGWLYATKRKPIAYEYPDKYTLVIRFDGFDAFGLLRTAGINYAIAREVVALDDGEGYRDWRNSVGTGAWMMKDYIPGSVVAFDRNPDYWETDPFIPENQLPYADHFKVLIIPDLSARMAALRTGKIDQEDYFRWEQKEELLRTAPQLQWTWMNGSGVVYRPRATDPPLNILEVRLALSMALDRQLLIDDYFHGEADYVAYPIPPNAVGQFTPYEELPPKAKEALTYDLEKAKQLMAEAGYPNGFKMEVDTNAINADLVSIHAAMWAELGVETIINVREPATFTSLWYGHAFNGLYVQGGYGGFGESFLEFWETGYTHNAGEYSDPWYDAEHQKMRATVDTDERTALAKALNIHVLENVLEITAPAGYQYVFWSPWLKRYNGEVSMGYCHWWKAMNYAWVDQDMKEDMTGRRD